MNTYHIDAYKDDIYTCVRSRCGFCFHACPVFLSKGFETYTSRGKCMIMKAFLEGKLPASQGLADRFALCTTCGYCTSVCDVDRPEIFNAFREDLRDAGYTIHRHDEIKETVEKQHSPYGSPDESLASRFAWKIDHGSPLLYYAGCTARYRERAIAEAMMMVLPSFDFLEEAMCCGSVLYRTGYRDDAMRQARALVSRIERYSTVVTTCAGCYKTLTRDYPVMGLQIRPEVLHSTQYLVREYKEGRLALSPVGKGTKVTYHDPCHLGRGTGEYDAPRILLEAMGYEVIEMEHAREMALCCGAGGGLKSINDTMATRIGSMRMDEAKRTGASLLVTACPFCVRNLRDAGGSELDVVDITELIAQSARHEK
ncbi:MAG TPA: (Fe-S)-binding protein [Methanomicrobia archaeon]|nr:(Fe-S)-binding protein [Methanomicrobia archaeon]